MRDRRGEGAPLPAVHSDNHRSAAAPLPRCGHHQESMLLASLFMLLSAFPAATVATRTCWCRLVVGVVRPTTMQPEHRLCIRLVVTVVQIHVWH